MSAPRVPAGPNSLAAAATRRSVIGAIASIPALAIGMPASASPPPAEWCALVAAYRHHKTDWERLNAARDRLELDYKRRRPPAPTKPQLAEPVREDMTITEIEAIPHDRPWSTYEAEMEEWDRRCQPLRQEIVGPAEAAERAAWERYTAALKAIEAYPCPTLPLLAEKADLIAAEYDCDDGHIRCVFADIGRLAREA